MKFVRKGTTLMKIVVILVLMGVINVELEEFVKINKRKVVQARQIIQQLLAHVDMEDIKGIWESAINVVSAAITVINQRSVIGAILDTI